MRRNDVSSHSLTPGCGSAGAPRRKAGRAAAITAAEPAPPNSLRVIRFLLVMLSLRRCPRAFRDGTSEVVYDFGLIARGLIICRLEQLVFAVDEALTDSLRDPGVIKIALTRGLLRDHF